jgi:hypothetical protein
MRIETPCIRFQLEIHWPVQVLKFLFLFGDFTLFVALFITHLGNYKYRIFPNLPIFIGQVLVDDSFNSMVHLNIFPKLTILT